MKYVLPITTSAEHAEKEDVGIEEGEELGSSDGLALGTLLDITVGVALGILDGSVLGTIVGILVGHVGKTKFASHIPVSVLDLKSCSVISV